MADRIGTVQPDGARHLQRPDYAHRGLQQISARVKYIILLTDGEQGSPAPFVPLINAMRRAGITLSTVGVSGDIGSRARRTCRLARRGQGRYYHTNNPRDVPRIMTQEARLAGRSFKQERDFKPRLATVAPAVRGLIPNDFPPCTATSASRPSPARRRCSPATRTRSSSPSGSSTGAGPGVDGGRRGGVVAGLGLVRGVQAPLAPGRALDDGRPQHARDPGGAAWHRGGGAIRVESFDAPGQYRNHLQTVAEVAFPDGTGQRVPVPQTAPGRYEGAFARTAPGSTSCS